jgi:hypothetical protein
MNVTIVRQRIFLWHPSLTELSSPPGAFSKMTYLQYLSQQTAVHVHQFTKIPFCYCGTIVLKKNLPEINFKTS